jgi:hypothetical protein
MSKDLSHYGTIPTPVRSQKTVVVETTQAEAEDMLIKAEMDTRAFEATLKGWEKTQLPFATARALTLCASQAIKPALRGAMEERFNNPTPYALNSLAVTPATKTRL